MRKSFTTMPMSVGNSLPFSEPAISFFVFVVTFWPFSVSMVNVRSSPFLSPL